MKLAAPQPDFTALFGSSGAKSMMALTRKENTHLCLILFYLLGNPSRVMRDGRQSFYIWLKHKDITTKLIVPLKTSVHPARSGADTVEDASR